MYHQRERLHQLHQKPELYSFQQKRQISYFCISFSKIKIYLDCVLFVMLEDIFSPPSSFLKYISQILHLKRMKNIKNLVN